MNIQELLSKAKHARPTSETLRLNWQPMYPVFHQLRQNGFGTTAAIDWMIAEGMIDLSNRARALNAFKQIQFKQAHGRPSNS